jgi:SAM-dependent methyltransferase
MQASHMTVNHEKTSNSHGYMHPLSSIAKRFVEFAKITNGPVIDMGCAYGLASIAALEAGAQKVIACDLSPVHLSTLETRIHDPKLKAKLKLQAGSFPDDFNFTVNSIDAVLLAHILPYLTGPRIEHGLQKLHQWLKPGGKLFILSYSIYIKELINDKFITEYNRRLASGMSWPGYFENFNAFSDLPDEDSDYSAFPAELHFLDKPVLVAALQKFGFEIEYAEYLDGKDNGAMADTWHDGREYVGIIARKPL